MAQWPTTEARQQFTRLVTTAQEQGPQLVTRRRKPVAILLSVADFGRLAKQADHNFAQLLAESPFEPADLDGVTMRLGNGR